MKIGKYFDVIQVETRQNIESTKQYFSQDFNKGDKFEIFTAKLNDTDVPNDFLKVEYVKNAVLNITIQSNIPKIYSGRDYALTLILKDVPVTHNGRAFYESAKSKPYYFLI